MAKILKHFYLTEKQCSKLELESSKTGASQAEIIREAIDKYFYDEKRNFEYDDDLPF